MRRVAVVVAVVAAGCGRIGFDDRARASASGTRLVLADPGEELDDFPLLVVLDDTRVDRTQLASDASNLAFTGSDGARLAVEIESAGALGGPSLYAWVLVPRITGGTTLTLGYDGDGSAGDVWSTSYLAVWHMTGSAGLHDSGPHHADGFVTGTTSTPGPVGPARAFDSSHPDAIVVPSLAGVAFSALTASGWMRSDVVNPSGYDAVVTREFQDGTDDDFFVGVDDSTAIAGITIDATDDAKTVGPPIGLGEWHHFAEVYDDTTLHSYVDGVDVGSANSGGGRMATSAGPVYLGCDRDNNGGSGSTPQGVPDNVFLDGALDEVRVETAVRDAAWIAYDVAAMQDRVIQFSAP